MATLKAIPGGQAATGTEPYGLTPEFERAMIYLCCANRELYGRIGARLDPKALVDKTAIQLLKAAQEIAADIGEGPSSPLSVVQRLRAWREAGKVTIEQVKEAVEYLDAAEDAGLLTAEEVIAEMVRILKKRAQRENAKKVMDTLAKGGDFAKLGAEIAATERIGETRVTMGETLHESILDEIVADNSAARFPTGCAEIDHITGGGLPIGYTIFLGREKSGKSMVLSSIGADALWRGKTVAIATLELASKKQIERVLANLLNCSLHEVQSGSAVVRHRMERLKGQIGRLQVQYFQPDTPVADILMWVERLREHIGPVDLLVVDYADLVGAGRLGKEENDYKAAKVVGNTLRNHAVQHGYVTITASQGKRGSGTAGKPLDMDDGADSQHKVRLADLVFAMRMDQEQKDMVDWTIVGARDGNDRVNTGPLPTDKERARMFPVNRKEPWNVKF